MKKLLLLCLFTIFAPANGMQLLRTGITNIKRYTNSQTIPSLLAFIQTKKVSILQSPVLTSNNQQSHEKQYSYSNNNSGDTHSNPNWSSHFSWGKISSLMPTLSAWSWLSNEISEDEATRLLNKRNLSSNEYQELLVLLIDKDQLNAIMAIESLRHKLIILLAKNAIMSADEINIAIKLISNYPELATSFFTAYKFIERKPFDAMFKIDQSGYIEQRQGDYFSTCAAHPEFEFEKLPAFLLGLFKSTNTANRNKLVLSIVQGLKKNNLGFSKIDQTYFVLLDYIHGLGDCRKLLSSKDIYAYSDLIAFLGYSLGIKFKNSMPVKYQVYVMNFYYALKSNPTLWELAPGLHTFDITTINNEIINTLRRDPNLLETDNILLFTHAPKEIKHEIFHGIHADVSKNMFNL